MQSISVVILRGTRGNAVPIVRKAQWQLNLSLHNNTSVPVLYVVFCTMITYHQSSFLPSKFTKNGWRLRLRLRPHWGAHSAPPDPLAGLRVGKGRGGEGWMGREWDGI